MEEATQPITSPIQQSPVIPPPTPSPVEKKQSEKPSIKKTRKNNSLLLILVIILIIVLAIITVIAFSPKKQTTATITPTPTKVIHNPAFVASNSAAFLPTATDTPQQVLWAAYPSTGDLGDYGISFAYPKGWMVNYRKVIDPLTSTPYTRFEFDFLPLQVTPLPTPSDWFGWGTMIIDVYPRNDDINSWIATNMPEFIDKATLNNDTRIGTGTLYIVTPTQDTNLVEQYVALGYQHSFHLLFPHTANTDATRRIKKEIWSKLNLK